MRPRLLGTLAAAVAWLACAGTARAQRAVVAADADVLLGIEGGGLDHARGVRRSRTTLRLGAQGYVDEFPSHALSAALLVELEPRASAGADFRYLFRIEDAFVLHIGAVGLFAPRTLFGATAGAVYEIELADEVALDFGPVVQTFFFGSDLPERSVLWQVLGQGGVRGR
ncbi:MAG: hypothetical protein HY908_11110, partial [Myxococcales bacterium]|nr:hypothetical protein [Myxococcales bacterium]